jgi:hypothetical protein
MEDVAKCDVDKSEDDSWNEYDPDFSAQWEEPHSDGEDNWFDDN